MIKNIKSNTPKLGSFCIVYKGTIKYEKPGIYGISHLVEHCMCEQVKKMEDDFLINGISWNADTSNNYMKFYMIGLDDNLKELKDTFLNSIIDYKITKEVFEHEKNIIISEYISTYSNQYEMFSNNFFKKFFNSAMTLGVLSDIKSITYEQFIDFKNKYFNNPTHIFNISKSKYKNSHIKFSKQIKIKNDIVNNNFQAEKYGTYDDNRILLFYDKLPIISSNKYKLITYMQIFNAYMNIGLSSPLYTDIREKLKNVYSINSSIDKIDDNCMIYCTQLSTSNDNVENVRDELIKSYKNHANNLNKTRYLNILKYFRNEIKDNNILNYANFSNIDKLNKAVQKNILNSDSELNFNDFSKVVKDFINKNEFKIVIDTDI
jgi:predicted Zn-dependent peptidase